MYAPPRSHDPAAGAARPTADAAAPQDTAWRFGERLGETLLGVALAYAFGLLLPALRLRR